MTTPLHFHEAYVYMTRDLPFRLYKLNCFALALDALIFICNQLLESK